MTEHRLLTGADNHEPKGVENASSGQVYVSNGSGSGVWTDRLAGISAAASALTGTIPDISSPNSSFFVSSISSASITKIYTILGGAISGTGPTIRLYINGISNSTTFTIPTAGSGPAKSTIFTVSPTIAVSDGDVLEFRSDGASDTSATLTVTARTS